MCVPESSGFVRILSTPLLRPEFEGLKDLEEVIPPELMSDSHQNFLTHLKLSLAGLPDRRITEEMVGAVVHPFMQEVEQMHTTIVKRIWIDVILSSGATFFTLGLLLFLSWALKLGKHYAMRKFVERFRRRNGDTAGGAAMQLGNIKTAQEEVIVQQKSEKKSARPKSSQGETSSKKSLAKN